MIYRAARLRDSDDILRLLLGLGEEVGFGAVNTAKALARIRDVVSNGAAFVAEDNGIVASVGLEDADWWYSDDKFIGDRWFYVHPDYRTTRAALALKNLARRYAKHRGLPLLLGPLGPNPERRAKLFARSMDLVGMIYMETNNG